MYGFLHCGFEDFVIKNFGADAWQEVMRKCGIKLRGGSFLNHKVYSDELSFQLFKGATECLGLDYDIILERFGSHFLTYCCDMGFEKLLRALGSNLYDFLTNLDNLHDHLGSIYTGMKAPSFRVTASPLEEEVLHLHYYSSRHGLHPFVRGLVKAAALVLFDTPVAIRTQMATRCRHDRTREHVVLEIRHSTPASPCKGRRRHSITPYAVWPQLSNSPSQLPLTAKTFADAFPFHLVADKNFVLRQIGKGLRRFIGHLWTSKQPVKFDQVFSVSRPVVDNDFYSLLRSSNMVFVVQTKKGVLRMKKKNKPVKEKEKDDKEEELSLRLKGQMIHLPESESLLYLCSPRVTDFEEMKDLGLYLSDFPLHDRTRDLLFMSHQRKGQRELYRNLEETTNNLKILEAKRREDQRKTQNILMSIFPPKVAAKLCHDEPVEAEHFDMVTCLVSDIVGFTAMCGNDHVDPIDVVRMLNRLYLQFDALSQVHEVYKLETIGDAYVVVAGIPQYVDGHANRILEMAFGMINVTKHIFSPVDSQHIHIRVGVHSGPIIGAVVGLNMPRYCLFGSTVTMANSLEAISTPGRITLSDVTRSFLPPDAYSFEENPAGRGLSIKCFFAYKRMFEEPPDNLQVESCLNTSGGHFRSPSTSPVPSEQVTPNGSGSPNSKSDLLHSVPQRIGSRKASTVFLSTAAEEDDETPKESRSPSPTLYDIPSPNEDQVLRRLPNLLCPGMLDAYRPDEEPVDPNSPIMKAQPLCPFRTNPTTPIVTVGEHKTYQSFLTEGFSSGVYNLKVTCPFSDRNIPPFRRPSRGGDDTRKPSRGGDDTRRPSRGGDDTRRPSKSEEDSRRPSRGDDSRKAFRSDDSRRPSKSEEDSRRPSKSEMDSRRPSRGDESRKAFRSDDSRRPSGSDESRRPSKSDDSRRPSKSDDSRRPSKGDDSRRPSRSDDSRRPSRSDDSRRPSKGDDSRRPSRSDDSRRPSRSDESRRPSRSGEDLKRPSGVCEDFKRPSGAGEDTRRESADATSTKKKLPSLFWWAKRSPSSLTLPDTACSHVDPQPRRRGRSLESSMQLLTFSSKVSTRKSLVMNAPRQNCSCSLKKIFGLCRHRLDTTYTERIPRPYFSRDLFDKDKRKS